MRCYPVSTRLNLVANDDAECSRPAEVADFSTACSLREFMAGVCERWISNQGDIRGVRRIQAITIVWMSVEALVSLFSAWRAPESCAARLRWGQWHRAFLGGSSAVEISCKGNLRHAEKQATHIAGALLFALAAFVAITSVASLNRTHTPRQRRRA